MNFSTRASSFFSLILRKVVCNGEREKDSKYLVQSAWKKGEVVREATCTLLVDGEETSREISEAVVALSTSLAFETGVSLHKDKVYVKLWPETDRRRRIGRQRQTDRQGWRSSDEETRRFA